MDLKCLWFESRKDSDRNVEKLAEFVYKFYNFLKYIHNSRLNFERGPYLTIPVQKLKFPSKSFKNLFVQPHSQNIFEM